MTSHQNAGLLLAALFVAAGVTGCKKEEPTAPPPVVPAPVVAPEVVVVVDAGLGDADAGAADPDLAVITVTAVDIDTRLAAMCGIAETDVFFKFDSTQLQPDAKERLDKIATCATTGAAKGKDLLIVGRAGPIGSEEVNKQIGSGRAESVARYLQEQGVKQARTETESKGEPETTPPAALWPLERRVTIRLQEQQ